MSITTDRIDLYTTNVSAHLQYKEHIVLLSYSLRSKIDDLGGLVWPSGFQ